MFKKGRDFKIPSFLFYTGLKIVFTKQVWLYMVLEKNIDRYS